MATADGMLKYCYENGTGKGFNKSSALKHFGVIEQNLLPNEKVQVCFIGLNNYESFNKHNGNYAYVITDKRIIFAQKKLMGENLKIVLLDNLNDISKSTGMMMGILCIDTIKETFNVGIDKKAIDTIHDLANKILFMNRESKHQPKSTTAINTKSPVEQVKEMKELLDMGIITQEEFDKKKGELLNL